MRLLDVQTWPALSMRAHRTPGTATSRSASLNTMNGSTEPSSRFTFLSCSAAATAIRRPTAVDPVNATRSTLGWATSAEPVAAPPVTTLTTPGGSTSYTCAISRFDRGFWWGGLQTTVLPAAIAGATFHAISSSGKLNGTIAATTPKGSLIVKFNWWAATGGIELP